MLAKIFYGVIKDDNDCFDQPVSCEIGAADESSSYFLMKSAFPPLHSICALLNSLYCLDMSNKYKVFCCQC